MDERKAFKGEEILTDSFLCNSSSFEQRLLYLHGWFSHAEKKMNQQSIFYIIHHDELQLTLRDARIQEYTTLCNTYSVCSKIIQCCQNIGVKNTANDLKRSFKIRGSKPFWLHN